MKKIFGFLCLVFLLNCASKNPAKYSQIQYEAEACFGTCPIFKLTINPDRTAFLEAEHFVFENSRNMAEFSNEKEGNFTATLSQTEYAQLLKLLDDANPKNLKNEYTVGNISDLPTANLTLKFADGTSKKISDYGKNGTEKLRKLYNFFESLPKSQKWTKVK